MSAYYNEIDKFAAAWLRELIKAGHIADGEVDERSIADVRADDLRGFAQCHFFAGIGGWSRALRLAGWPDERHVWTGSCPCQPFSSAGAQAGGHDSRDLWPVWFQLVAECRPHVVFGEQVEAAIGHGWLDRLCDDLESEGYAVGACGLPAASVGAFHIRQRLWFVADADGRHAEHRGLQRSGQHGLRTEGRRVDRSARDGERAESDVADTDGERRSRERLLLRPETAGRDAREVLEVAGRIGAGELGDTTRRGLRIDRRASRNTGHADEPSAADAVEHAEREGLEGHGRNGDDGHKPGRLGADATRPIAATGHAGFWSDADWLPCTDGKARPVEPGTFPLAHGVSARVGRLRGYGNAIVPELAAEFIEAYADVTR